MAVGDKFTVMQVGTVGVEGACDATSHKDESVDTRSDVQNAALMLVNPANGQQQQCEVFTVEQMRQELGQVAWCHSGQPAMDSKHVRLGQIQCGWCIAVCV